MVLSLKVPVAVNCSVAPSASDALGAVTEIEESTADVTLRFAWPEIPPEVAVMVVLPMPCDVARPVLPIVAVLVLVEVQVTEEDRFCVLPSE